MNAPGFWWRTPPNVLARLLAPLGAMAGAVAAGRMRRAGLTVPVPVLCVGNVTVGGSGKTPTVLALARLATEAGARPFLLSRGYGARVRAPLRVDPDRHDAMEVGDEPLLLARAAPTIVSPDRAAGALACIAGGAGLIVMDDGLQNPALAKSFAIAVFDAGSGIGNGLCLPAGPLRAPLAAHRGRVQAALVIGDGREAEAARWADALDAPPWRARLVPDPAAARRLAGRGVVALAGLGQPAKFLRTLEECGADIRGALWAADHARFARADLEALARRALREDLLVATTEKDMARMGTALVESFGTRLVVVPVRLAFDDEAAVRAAIRPFCGPAP